MSGSTPILKSQFFTKHDFDHSCHDHLAEKILDHSCHSVSSIKKSPPTDSESND